MIEEQEQIFEGNYGTEKDSQIKVGGLSQSFK